MAKLNKQEVNAVANKIVRELTEQTKLNKLRYISEYIPSPTYLKMESLINEYNKLLKEQDEIEKKRDKIYNEIRELNNSLGFEFHYHPDEEILQRIIDKEYGVKEITSVESLKEDIVIAGIDDTFDVEKFIKDKLAEYIS